MNPYALALGLAFGDAKAEKPKECIDKLVINIEVKADDLLGQYLYSSTGKQQVSDALIKLFEKEVGVPSEVVYESRTGYYVTVIYTTRGDFKRDMFPTYEAYTDFINRNIMDPSERAAFDESEKLIAVLPKQDQESIKEALLDDAYRQLFNTSNGVTDIVARTSYVFEPLEITDPIMRFYLREDNRLKLLTRNIVHEVGHTLLGLGHAEQEYLDDGKVNVMYPGVHIDAYPFVLAGAYSFSPEDKEKIRAQMCEPEEPK